MGDRQSMAVLGGWYLYRGERICQVTKQWDWRDMLEVYWADCESFGYATPKYLTPLPEGLFPLLLSSNNMKQGETNE